jgi:hypothetical protein
MPVTYKKIASATVGAGGAANIEFTSIPGTYDDIVILVSARTTSNVAGEQWVFCEMNINSQGIGTNQSGRHLTGRTSADSFTAAGRFYASSSASTASTFGNGQIYFPNYKDSTNKSFSIDSVSEDNSSTGGFLHMGAVLWSQTAAITSIAFTPRSGSGNFAQHSTAVLYGISKS